MNFFSAVICILGNDVINENLSFLVVFVLNPIDFLQKVAHTVHLERRRKRTVMIMFHKPENQIFYK